MEGDDVGRAVFDSIPYEVVEIERVLFFAPQKRLGAFANPHIWCPAEDVSERKGEAVDSGVDQVRNLRMLFDVPQMEVEERGTRFAKEINHDDTEFHARIGA
jgi:ribulose 1,5-bisphosphate carboxylase large subunit-like protein